MDATPQSSTPPGWIILLQPPGRPSGAGGFSKELYRRVGILGAEAFPREVEENMKKVGDAFCHTCLPAREAFTRRDPRRGARLSLTA